MIYANHIIINDFCLCLGGKEALLSYRKFHLRHIRSSVVIIFLVTYRPVLLITTLDAHYPRLLHEITSSIYQRIPVQCLIFFKFNFCTTNNIHTSTCNTTSPFCTEPIKICKQLDVFVHCNGRPRNTKPLTRSFSSTLLFFDSLTSGVLLRLAYFSLNLCSNFSLSLSLSLGEAEDLCKSNTNIIKRFLFHCAL